MHNKGNRASDLLLYICIALGVVGVIFAGVFFSVAHPEIDGDAVKIPTLLFLVSLLMFGMLIRDYYHLLNTARLRWTILFMFLAQLGAGTVLQHLRLFHSKNFMLLVLAILIPEYAMLRFSLSILLGAKPNAYTRKSRH